MDNTGEDSGLEFEDHSFPEDMILQFQQQQQHQQQEINPEDVDEGISVQGGNYIQQQGGMQNNQFVQPPEEPHQMIFQQEINMQQQQIFVDPNVGLAPVNPINQINNNVPALVNDVNDLIVVNLVSDDNNNDRPDDVNNNTTDPELQQLQQQQFLMMEREREIQEQIQQQINQQFELPLLINGQQNGEPDTTEETSNSSSVNNGQIVSNLNSVEAEDNDKDDKKKKKKRGKKKKRFVVGPDGIFPRGDITDKGVENEQENQENDKPPQDGVEIEYVPEKLELSVFDPMYKAFANVFENFRLSDIRSRAEIEDVKPKLEDLAKSMSKVPKIDDDDLDEKKDDDDGKPKISKRKLKQMTRPSVAELKQVVPRPDVVEMHDVTAKDPKLLVHLKSYRNTVPVPRHWCYKRKYLQGKRGIEKPPFDLPGFIKKTGIMEMRAALAEKEETKTLKSKMREKIRPKMGKIDVDYQKLHDAFFKWQSKPKMTIHGDLYYEGKEFETRMKDKKPGDLSDDLRTALGMPVGPNAHRVPPPWLIAMQRYGPPPSYPHLKIPGLNAPIPDGCSFGYHAGGWGKPPVDEFGRPLYGDVFGTTNSDGTGQAEEEYVDKTLWGELESEEEPESEEEEEMEEEKEEEEGQKVEESGLQTPAEGMATPSGFSSIPTAGLETPELIELRKRKIEQDMEGGETPALFTVLPEKRVDRITGSMMASTHIYDMSSVKEKKSTQDSGRIELALDPSELDLDTEAMAARYEQTLKERQTASQGEDLSDMVAEHAAKQKTKRKRQQQQQDTKQTTKKYKEFKF